MTEPPVYVHSSSRLAQSSMAGLPILHRSFLRSNGFPVNLQLARLSYLPLLLFAFRFLRSTFLSSTFIQYWPNIIEHKLTDIHVFPCLSQAIRISCKRQLKTTSVVIMLSSCFQHKIDAILSFDILCIYCGLTIVYRSSIKTKNLSD